jgi:hypothetical protein
MIAAFILIISLIHAHYPPGRPGVDSVLLHPDHWFPLLVVLPLALQPHGKYLDCADHKKLSCPHVDRRRQAFVTLEAIVGYGGRAPLLFRTVLTTS